MDEKKPHPERKQIRLKRFSYSDNSMYFITICSENRKSTFGEIVGYGACDVPYVKLSHYGNVIEKYIHIMDRQYSNIIIDEYVIMPNHIHMLIGIANNTDNLPDSEIRISRFGTSRAPYPTEESDKSSTLIGNQSRANEIIPKFVSLLKRYCNHEIGYNIWQKRYFDHIIRNEEDYRNSWLYIDNNPAKWAEDKYYQ